MILRAGLDQAGDVTTSAKSPALCPEGFRILEGL